MVEEDKGSGGEMSEVRHIDDGTGHVVCSQKRLQPYDKAETFAGAVNLILSGNFLLPCSKCWSGVRRLAESDPTRFYSEERVR